jgi:hypothetical protein
MTHAKESAMTSPQALGIALPARAMFEIPDVAGLKIRCLAGCLWLTLDNDPRDLVLEPGDSYSGTVHRRALVYALKDAKLAVASATASPQRHVAPRLQLLAGAQPA